MGAKIVTRPAFTVVGLAYYGKNEHEEIPQLWQEFGKRYHEIQHAVNQEVGYGVCDHVDLNTGQFDYLAGVEVSRAADLPEGMVHWEIPEQTYAVFTCTLPALGEIFDQIYQTWLPQSGYQRVLGPEFELYEEGFDSEDPDSEMYVYVPVEQK